MRLPDTEDEESPQSRSFASLSSASGRRPRLERPPRAAHDLAEREEEKMEKNESSGGGGAASRRHSASTQRSGEYPGRGGGEASPNCRLAGSLSGYRVRCCCCCCFCCYYTTHHGAQVRRLFHAPFAFVRLCVCFFFLLLFSFRLGVFFFFLIFGLSLPRALGGGGDGVWDHA